MNPTNEQELDPIINIMDMWDFSPFQDEDTRRERVYKEIEAHTNAEIAKVLERLEAELNEQKKAAETNLAYHVDVTKNERLIRDWQGTVHGIEFCRPAIAAERAKLKEVK